MHVSHTPPSLRATSPNLGEDFVATYHAANKSISELTLTINS